MASKTRELREKIDGVMIAAVGPSWAGYETDQILKACKESGLMFTKTGIKGDELEGACICKVEEIEV